MHETPDVALAGVALKDGIDRLGVGQVALDEVDPVGLVSAGVKKDSAYGQRPTSTVRA